MALLRITSGDSAGAAFAIGSGSHRVGRADGNHLRLPDGSVSGSHCEVALDPAGNLIVRDLGSTNGTYIQGQRVREALVRPGQNLRLGNLELIFENSLAAQHTPAMSMPVKLPPPPVPQAPAPATLVEETAAAESLVAGPDDCVNHPGIRAIAVCTRCGRKACAKCTKQQKLGMAIVDFCMACGGQCKKMSVVAKEAAKAAAVPTTFGKAVSGAFKYPLRGNGLILLIIGTILYALMDAFLGTRIRMLNFYHLIAKIIAFVLGYGYLFAYMQRIVTSSASGEDEPPEWPEVSDISSDVIRPFWQLTFTIVVAFLPAFFVAEYLGPIPGQLANALGIVYFPMALLAVAMADSYTGLNPVYVASSIMKIPKQYFLTCLIFVGINLMWTNLRHDIYQIDIAFLPQVCYWFAYLYVLIVGMRILGCLYFLNRRQLGWGL